MYGVRKLCKGDWMGARGCITRVCDDTAVVVFVLRVYGYMLRCVSECSERVSSIDTGVVVVGRHPFCHHITSRKK